MQEFNKIGEDLFNKIRGRFPEVTIGDETGTVTNKPTMARFFDFDYNGLGKVSISLDENEGLTVIYSKDFMKDQDEQTKEAWYNFLKELRVFSKKRMLDYSVRDITKSNLTKRDYKFLAKNPEDGQMTESKLYGTSKISYQKVGEARIVIQHTENINQESATGRTQKIGKIYIESADGERFRYPYKHLSGARAMARHVAEGGNTYDDFGKHIVGLSEEMGKLRKFKNYMGRSAVMAESLAGYVDVVKERIATVKKTIESLQKPAYYAETVAAFEAPILEDVPSDVAENWIDQLTIKQFNEELADVFPYIYKLVSEATRAKELGPEDLVSETEKQKGVDGKVCWKGYKRMGTKMKGGKRVDNCVKVKEDEELEQGFEEMMGQFSEANNKCRHCGCPVDNPKPECNCEEDCHDDIEEGWKTVAASIALIAGLWGVNNSMAEKAYEASPQLQKLIQLHQAAEARGDEEKADELEMRISNHKVRLDLGKGEVKDKFGDPIDVKEKDTEEGNAYANAVRQAKMDGKKKGDKVKGPDGDEITLEKEGKTPLGEFILSYFDRETGEFPKGETAVLTMVEKDYGEQFIEPAKAFIEQVTAKFDEWQMRSQPQQMEAPDTGDYDRMRELAGLR
jgi:hypothetical protein